MSIGIARTSLRQKKTINLGLNIAKTGREKKKRDLVTMMFASEDKASGAVNTSGSEVRAPDKKALIWR